MVAVTVILAAIIAAFVFGMAGNVKSTKVVAFTVERTSSTGVSVTSQGGQDWASLSSVVSGGQSTVTPISPSVGAVTSVPLAKNSRITLVGTFNDGSQQVLIDKTL